MNLILKAEFLIEDIHGKIIKILANIKTISFECRKRSITFDPFTLNLENLKLLRHPLTCEGRLHESLAKGG